MNADKTEIIPGVALQSCTSVGVEVFDETSICDDLVRSHPELAANQHPELVKHNIRVHSGPSETLKFGYDKTVQLAHCIECLGDVVWDFNLENVLNGHHQFHRIKAHAVPNPYIAFLGGLSGLGGSD